jgi:hypothetical protein
MGFQATVFRPVSFAVHFFLLIEEVEVELGHLELSNITVGIEAGGKLDMIFHKRDFCP